MHVQSCCFAFYRVRTLFWTKTSRTFQGLSRTHFAFFKDSIQCKKEIWVYVFFSSTTTWAILSWRSFILGTWESGLDKVSTEIQGLSSTDYNFQGLSRPWTFYFKFQGLSRCVRTLLLNLLFVCFDVLVAIASSDREVPSSMHRMQGLPLITQTTRLEILCINKKPCNIWRGGRSTHYNVNTNLLKIVDNCTT